MSMAFAEKHRLIAAVDRLRGVYEPFQFRRLVQTEEEDCTALVKGMMVINPFFTGEKLVLPESCVKVRGPRSDFTSIYGLDVTLLHSAHPAQAHAVIGVYAEDKDCLGGRRPQTGTVGEGIAKIPG